jgi:hypothetical protein
MPCSHAGTVVAVSFSRGPADSVGQLGRISVGLTTIRRGRLNSQLAGTLEWGAAPPRDGRDGHGRHIAVRVDTAVSDGGWVERRVSGSTHGSAPVRRRPWLLHGCWTPHRIADLLPSTSRRCAWVRTVRRVRGVAGSRIRGGWRGPRAADRELRFPVAAAAG